MSRTAVIVLTPAGRGAVATIRVEGAEATRLMAENFLPATPRPLEGQPVNKILFGRWGSTTGEELVVARRAPDAWEVHSHGGTAAVRQIVESLVASGGEAIAWRDWLPRVESDPLRSQARLALAEARTERAALVLLDQYHGALRRAVEEVLTAIEQEQLDQAHAQLQTLLKRAALGEHLVRPWRVVLAGRPNVGKSSLINALVGYRRAIVFDQPGTTRDVVTATTAIDGWPVELADTAGLRASQETIEAAGVERTRAGLAAADLVLLVFDASAPWSEEDQTLADTWPQALRLHNKSDQALDDPQRPAGLATSATTGQGLDELLGLITRRLVPTPPLPGEAVPFLPHHTTALRAADAVLAAQPPAAAVALRALLTVYPD